MQETLLMTSMFVEDQIKDAQFNLIINAILLNRENAEEVNNFNNMYTEYQRMRQPALRDKKYIKDSMEVFKNFKGKVFTTKGN